MTLPDVLRTVRWMVRDTLRQSIATKLFWVMLAVTVTATLFCLSVRVYGDDAPARLDYEVPAVLPEEEVLRIGMEQMKKDGELPATAPVKGTPEFDQLWERAWEKGSAKAKADGVRVMSGRVSFGFGAASAPMGRNRTDSVRYVQLLLAGFVGDTIGVLLALLWTAGFLPTFLEPQSATVLLAKPAPRWAILLGKYLGVVLFVAFQAGAFVGLTWLALGLSTGVWNAEYWLAVPLLVINFAVFYSVSTFLAVWTRSTVASAFGVLLFWALCWAVNYTHHRLIAFPPPGLADGSSLFLDIGYWILPKPLDLGGIFYDAMRAEGFVGQVPELKGVQDQGKFFPWLSVLADGLFAILTLGFAAYEFEQTDY